MRAVHVNFIQLPAARWPGRVLLVLALAAVVVVSYQYWSVARSVDEADTVLTRLERRAARAESTPAPTVAEGAEANRIIQQAGEVARKLAVPWEQLFAALESMRHDQVALLVAEPDAHGGTVRITAEAKDAAAMTQYVEQLREEGVLADVVISTHQVVLQSPYRPVRFVFAGTWAGKP